MRHLRYTALLALALLTACAPRTGPVAENDVSAQPSAAATAAATTQPSASAAPRPSATSQPTPTLVPAASAPAAATPTATTPPDAPKTITILEPAAGATLTNPVTVKGTTNFWPFEATLTGRVFDAAGHQLGVGPVMVNAPDIGQGGPFEATIPFIAPRVAQAGTLELFEASAKDGSIVVQQRIAVQLPAEQTSPAPTQGIQLDSPAAGVAVTLPLHVAFRGAQPNATLTARLRWSNGTVLEQAIPVVTGADGVGYGTANVQWNTESMPPPTPAGAATFELVGADGAVVRSVAVQVLPDEQTQRVDVAWTAGDYADLIVFQQAIGRTPQVASAALRELLNGPPEGNAAGAQTALPTLEEIVTYAGRQPGWGYEVRLIKLTITDGVATANFSAELGAYGGGAARVGMIRQQIERTLRQFGSVKSVVIQIEGQSAGVLEP